VLAGLVLDHPHEPLADLGDAQSASRHPVVPPVAGMVWAVTTTQSPARHRSLRLEAVRLQNPGNIGYAVNAVNARVSPPRRPAFGVSDCRSSGAYLAAVRSSFIICRIN
jgi:hypothetical protein